MNQRLKLHILFWVSYIVFESYLEYAWISTSYQDMEPVSRFLMAGYQEIVQLVLKIPLTYGILYLIYHAWNQKPQPALTGFVILIVFVSGVIIHRFLIVKLVLPYIYHESASNDMLFVKNRIISSFVDLLFVVCMAIIGKQYRMHQRWKEQEKSLLREKLESELKFLRTQTNPHFLFNTLNNIYALARKKSDETADVVLKLSKLMRFMLYESKKQSISVAEELRVLDDYFELERIRYNERLNLIFHKKIDDPTEQIAPLILLPFVENAFKHGASETRFDSYINISVETEKGLLRFELRNSKEPNDQHIIVENIGLSNVRRQLELMYPHHKLTLDNGHDYFNVSLTLNLLEYARV